MSTYCIYILYLDYNQNIDEYGYEYIETYKIRRMSHALADCILDKIFRLGYFVIGIIRNSIKKHPIFGKNIGFQ